MGRFTILLGGFSVAHSDEDRFDHSHMYFKPWLLLMLAAGAFQAVAHPAGDDVTIATRRFVDALTPEQRAQALFDLDARERLDWHFIPRQRGGVALKDLTPAQRHQVTGMLGAILSHRGLLQAATIMSLESVLAELEQGRGPVRDAELYYVSVFGRPDEKGTWGWRLEGHHLSLNFVLADGKLASVTPSFWGANPAEVRAGPLRGLRALGDEQDLGRALLGLLTGEQRRKAIVATNAPSDIILTPNREAELLSPPGIGATEMTGDQVTRLRDLVGQYVRRYRSEVADEELARIEQAGFDKLHFAWAGSTRPGEAHYYRVQGPTFILEFDNVQNGANHIHTVWRNIGRDFGADVLAEHYRAHPH